MEEGGGSTETKFTDVGREIHHQFNSTKKRIGGTGGGSSEMQFTDFETATDRLDGSAIFHIVYDILGFILFMHQQIPSVIQDITREFDELRDEYKELEAELLKDEVKPILTRRKQAARKREVKMEIKRLEKLMNCISNLKTAVKSMFADVPNVEKISLVLGPSPLRPLHVYEMCFVNVKADAGDFSRSKLTELLSRKAIRALISRGAGSDSYGGPTKLFLLVKAPSTLNLPLHFLPKREFQLNRKVVPFQLRFRGKTLDLDTDAQPNGCVGTGGLLNSASNDLICAMSPNTTSFLVSLPHDSGFNVNTRSRAWFAVCRHRKNDYIRTANQVPLLPMERQVLRQFKLRKESSVVDLLVAPSSICFVECYMP